jgi:hypothetical protein
MAPRYAAWLPSASWGARLPDRISVGSLASLPAVCPVSYMHHDDVCQARLLLVMNSCQGQFEAPACILSLLHIGGVARE